MFSDANIQKIGENRYHVSYGDDRSTFAEFYWHAIPDEEQTLIKGYPCYRNVEMIRMTFAGDNTKIVERLVRKETRGTQPSDIERFPRQWSSFQNQQKQVADGMPLEHWAALDKARVLELKSANIHTVEQLASTPDGNLRTGWLQLRVNALAWLEEADSGAKVLAQNAEIEALRNELKALKNQMNGFKQENTSQNQINKVEINEQAAPPEEAIQPIKTRMRGRPKRIENGENIPATDTASI